MYFSRDEIKADLVSRFDEISGDSYPEDRLAETADGYVPVYYGDIIKDWAEMPSEFNDSWLEFGEDASRGIVRLMSVDLFAYYESLTRAVWDEILAEKAGE
jgi:hypothetical protein